MNPNSDFLNRSNYLVAFLAALVGMAAFKDELSQIKIELFGISTSLLIAISPMTLLILTAAYLGAIAHFSSNITFTKFPISKYFGSFATSFAIAGLAYPILLGLSLLISWMTSLVVLNRELIQTAALTASLLSAVSTVVISYLSGKILFETKLEKERAELLLSMSMNNELRIQKANLTQYEFLKKYEQLIMYSIKYLKVNGFGIGAHSGLRQLGIVLRGKKVFNDKDVATVMDLHRIRNLYAHGHKQLTQDEIKSLIINIDKLQLKIEQAILSIDK